MDCHRRSKESTGTLSQGSYNVKPKHELDI